MSFHFEIVSLLKKVGSRLDVIMCTTQKKKVKEESKLKRELLFLFFSFEKLDVNHLTKTSCCQSNKKERKKVSFSKVGRNVSSKTGGGGTPSRK